LCVPLAPINYASIYLLVEGVTETRTDQDLSASRDPMAGGVIVTRITVKKSLCRRVYERMAIRSQILPLENTQLKCNDFNIFKDEFIGDKPGHFGEVNLCKSDALQLRCAAKRFFCLKADERERVKIEQELQLLSRIKHPCLVQCYLTYWCNATSTPILLMELLEESLPMFINRQEAVIPFHIKVSLCHDIALGVSYLHVLDIVHGNLTSSNILILGETRAKVTDYWMMSIRSYGEMNIFTEIPEKIPYMAPERRNTIEDVTVKCDSFSVGVLLLEIDSQCITQPGSGGKTRCHSAKESPFTELAVRYMAADPSDRPTLDRVCQDIEDMKNNQCYRASLQLAHCYKEDLQNQFESEILELSAEVLDLKHKLSVMEAKYQQVNEYVMENVDKWSEMASEKADQPVELEQVLTSYMFTYHISIGMIMI